MSWTTGTPNTSLLTTYLLKKFIPALEDELQFMKFATKATIPQGMGVTARWNLFSSPVVNTTALTEGAVDGNELTEMTTAGTEATIAEYGEFIQTNRLMEFCQVSGSRSELVNRMSYGGARSLDRLIHTGPSGGTGAISTTTDFYTGVAANGGSGTAATPTAASAAALIGASKLLRDNAATGIRGVSGHPDGHFAAILSPRFELDMVTEGTTGRMTWAEAVTDVPGRMGQEKWVNGFMGSVYGTACYRTQAFTQTTITSTSDNNFVLADHGVGCLSIIDADPQIYINTPSSGDVGNPYRNRSTVAWHSYFAASLLSSDRVVRVYSLAT